MAPNPQTHQHTAAIERLIGQMRTQVADPLCLGDMAASVQLSTFHFDRVFRAVTGISAGAFQAALRIDAAKQLLIRTDAPVTEICFSLGFESLGSFTTRFSVSVGNSPTAFRAFAQRLATQDLAALLAAAFSAYRQHGEVRGTIAEAPSNDAFVWVGMFPKGLPSAHPASGTLRRGNGGFSLAAPFDGRFSFLAAALAPTSDWRAYFESGDHLYVATNGSCHVRQRELSESPLLQLRPLRLTDPPILIPLPLLALGAQQSGRSTAGRPDDTFARTSVR